MKIIITVCLCVLTSSLICQSVYPFGALQPVKNYTIDRHIDLPDMVYLTQSEPRHMAAKAVPIDISSSDFHLVRITSDGDKLYRYVVTTSDKCALRVCLLDLAIDPNTMFYSYTDQSLAPLAADYENIDNKVYITDMLIGQKFVLEYLEPKDVSNTNFQIKSVYYYYKSGAASSGFGKAPSCMVNIACPEGNDYQIEQRAVCKINVATKLGMFECTGTLLNNLRENGLPYILTANQCVYSQDSQDIYSWEFIFDYQSSTCSNPSNEPVGYKMTGAQIVSRGFQTTKQDHILLRYNKPLPLDREFVFQGWKVDTSLPSLGVCINHINGDIKKIATATKISNYISSRGLDPDLYAVSWQTTASGRATADYSLGAGLLNKEKLLAGHLVGSTTSCVALDPSREPDNFIRFSRSYYGGHTSDGFPRLIIWLNPDNLFVNQCRTLIYKKNASSIYPSHSNDLIIKPCGDRLCLESKEKLKTIQIFSLQGLPVSAHYLDGMFYQFDISGLPKGLYILHAIDRSDNIAVKKILIN